MKPTVPLPSLYPVPGCFSFSFSDHLEWLQLPPRPLSDFSLLCAVPSLLPALLHNSCARDSNKTARLPYKAIFISMFHLFPPTLVRVPVRGRERCNIFHCADRLLGIWLTILVQNKQNVYIGHFYLYGLHLLTLLKHLHLGSGIFKVSIWNKRGKEHTGSQMIKEPITSWFGNNYFPL